MSIVDAHVGEALSLLVKPPITQEQLERYANASGDFNPIHLDEEVARGVGLDGVIAHGMLSMAFIGQFVTQQIEDIPEAYVARLHVRFRKMIRLGDTLTCGGSVKQRGARKQDIRRDLIIIDCWARNQRGETVIAGEAVVAIPR